MTDHGMDELQSFFDAAKAQAAEPSADLLARVQADALALQPVRSAVVTERAPGILRQLFAAVGGWPAVTGLTAATVLGVWLGAVQPAGLSDSLSTALYGDGTLTVDPQSSFDFVLLEG
ncbi:hypothetical protein VK792_11360 [Mesobacterium sp. TK19101]|uniref:Dihydroorotate dehydrogenase n=1 Tax=Mesobacterium hydrothermale TaxID=3111907 RepID=A0ABU6HHF4_9RHOB|nr:hypothetical protein [Mesobacterium sp. TK19101]MEC3861883.1 hypothetical protein [Mesobacterium sp. TK19101]